MVCNGLIKKSPDTGVGSAKFWLKITWNVKRNIQWQLCLWKVLVQSNWPKNRGSLLYFSLIYLEIPNVNRRVLLQFSIHPLLREKWIWVLLNKIFRLSIMYNGAYFQVVWSCLFVDKCINYQLWHPSS